MHALDRRSILLAAAVAIVAGLMLFLLLVDRDNTSEVTASSERQQTRRETFAENGTPGGLDSHRPGNLPEEIAHRNRVVATPSLPDSRPEPEAPLLRISIISEVDGLPDPDAVVQITGADIGARIEQAIRTLNGFDRSMRVFADGQGVAQLRLPPGEIIPIQVYGGLATLGSVQDRIGPFEANSVRDIEVILPQARDFTYFGRVLDENESPVAGAGVELFDHGSLRKRMQTDSHGFFHVQLGVEGNPYATVTSPGHAPVYVDIDQGHDTSERAFDVHLIPQAILRGLVLSASGERREGLTVRLSTETKPLVQPRGNYISLPEKSWNETTGPDGQVVIQGLPSQISLDLTITRGSTRMFQKQGGVILESGKTTTRTWSLPSLARLSGKVIDTGGLGVSGQHVGVIPVEDDPGPRPLRFRRVHARGAIAETDPRGGFDFAELPPGRWRIGIVALSSDDSEQAVAPVSKIVELAPGGRVDVVLETWRGLSISGVVTNPSGRTLRSVSVHASGVTHEHEVGTRSDDQGRFQLRPLWPGIYRVTAGRAFENLFATSEPLEIEAGSDDVAFVLEPTMGALSLLLMDEATGRGIRGWVSCFYRDGDDIYAQHTSLDGRIDLKGLKPGIWDLAARDQRGRVANLAGVRIFPGQTTGPVIMKVGSGGSVLVSCHNPGDETTYEIRRGQAVVDRDLVAGDSPTRITVPAGRMTVIFYDNGREFHRREVTVAAGETIEVIAEREETPR